MQNQLFSFPLRKVISGGQTGADKAGLVAAKELGLETGGTAPLNWRVKLYNGRDGKDLSLESYGLVQHTSYDYPPRTIENVKNSDGTIWFGNEDSPGGKLTISTAIKYSKPYIINPTQDEFIEWCKRENIEVLNVAGNRLSPDNPNIFNNVYNFIKSSLTQMLSS